MADSLPATTIIDARGGPNLLIRILWFVFIGWWLSFVVISAAVLLSLTVIGIPLAIWIENRIPQVVTLKFDRTRATHVAYADGTSTLTLSSVPQRPFWQRALWYLLIGWWVTIAWLYVAWALCMLIVTMPVAFPMFSVTGKLLTLKRG